MSWSGIATVTRQELRLRVRAGRWRWLLGVWFVLLLVFMALLRAATGSVSTGQVRDRGVILYGGLVLFVLGLALLVVPALAAQSVNGDRERGTLATLQVTRLTSGEIALGKFLAAWGTALAFLLLTLPIVLYTLTQGGVPVLRMVTVTVVLALLLGTVCALALALSALLSRTTTSGVMAYLAVSALALGTLIAFGLTTAVTVEQYTVSAQSSCPTLEQLPPDLSLPEREQIRERCLRTAQPYQTSRPRTDRTWWLLAPNPFVILADSAPALPPETPAELRRRQLDQERGIGGQSARDLDPLGAIGRAVRSLRRPPDPLVATTAPLTADALERSRRRPVWPYGLAFDVALAAGALVVTERRLRTPTRRLPPGQRVA